MFKCRQIKHKIKTNARILLEKFSYTSLCSSPHDINSFKLFNLIPFLF